MRTINVNVEGMFIKKDNKNGGVKGEANATQLHIVFDETWSGYGKRVIWRDAYGENPVAVDLTPSVDGLINGDTLTFDTPIPAEPLAHPGWCTFTLDGYQTGDPSAIALTVSDSLRVYPNDTDYQPAEPTPSQAQQIMDAIEQIVPDMQEIAQEAKSWAVGGTNSREGEDTDNAKYYSQQAAAKAEEVEARVQDAEEARDDAEASASQAASSALAAAGSASEAAGHAESAQSSAQEAQEAESGAESAADRAENAALHTPYIGENGNWYVWNGEQEEFTDTGQPATALMDGNSGQNVRVWFGTVEEYNALEEIRGDTYYNILEGVVP